MAAFLGFSTLLACSCSGSDSRAGRGSPSSADVGNGGEPAPLPSPPDGGLSDTGWAEEEADVAAQADAGVGAEPLDSGYGLDLSGTWGQLMVMSSISDVPIVGEVLTRLAGYLLVDIVQDGNALTITTQLCGIHMDSSNNTVQTVIPDAFIASLGPQQRHGTVNPASRAVHFPRHFEVRGMVMEDMENEPMPEGPDDPRIIDQDNDGNPGVTVRVSGLINGELYVVQRVWDLLSGSISDEEHLDGLVEWAEEQVILGSDNWLLEMNTPETWVDPVAENSYFRSSRVADSISCDELLMQADTLYLRP